MGEEGGREGGREGEDVPRGCYPTVWSLEARRPWKRGRASGPLLEGGREGG